MCYWIVECCLHVKTAEMCFKTNNKKKIMIMCGRVYIFIETKCAHKDRNI